ncbi:lecithin--cholesterol acyltransferase [Leptospira ognonensis]|uniref:Lecithin--cholesterol acyltransferase n=1 Tax=Leptospira ognonensis TaxID=2484945 RepID=A0A4R9K3Y5_9LEPT|nr:alpha/beta fold hydrolase [Leptospira ognonensis]TGL60146.1 lecithin--cholesterol acyltransferase [Leptospira ognonensis]
MIGRFFRVSTFFSIVWLGLSCHASLPSHLFERKLKVDLNPSHLPVVFVPGIKGSVLKDTTGSTRWLTAGQALGFSTSDLRLTGESADLIPHGAIERVTAIPRLIDVDLYGPWLEEMSDVEGVDFYVFSYDWRKDNLNTRDQLVSFLKEISNKYKTKPALIGHSMGGMISFSTVNQDPSIVSKLVLVGVPFRGGIGYMKDLYQGNATGFNSKIQGPCMIAKYESVYSFFPRLGTKDSQGLVLDQSGVEMSVDFFKESSWKEHLLGFYGQKCAESDIPDPLLFQNILNRAKLFRESLDITPKMIKAQPPTMLLNAKNNPTRKAIRQMENRWNMDIVPREEGDGSVLLEHSVPQPGLTYETIRTEKEHSVMLNDPAMQKRILEFLRK